MTLDQYLILALTIGTPIAMVVVGIRHWRRQKRMDEATRIGVAMLKEPKPYLITVRQAEEKGIAYGTPGYVFLGVDQIPNTGMRPFAT